MMTIIPRHYDNLQDYMAPKRVTILYGPRRVGKTTLIERHLSRLAPGLNILSVSGDAIDIAGILGSQRVDVILDWAAGKDLVFVDEAQKIPNIGIGLKILIDHRPDLTVIATGSSSFDLAQHVGEPLTGRQIPLRMFPVSMGELSALHNDFELRQQLASFLVYGTYPDVLTAESTALKQTILGELASSYLFKDVLELDNLKGSSFLIDLLSLVALQLGSEVSHNELANSLSVSAPTIARYLDIFEKCFILYNLRGFSRNLRSEITRTSKYYFYDNGVRNAVINNFNPLNRRGDIGALWENFLVMERLKHRTYDMIYARDHFWRTWERKEIDLIEDRGGQLHAYEFKWSERKKTSAPGQFAHAYPDASFEVITPDNYLGFVT